MFSLYDKCVSWSFFTCNQSPIINVRFCYGFTTCFFLATCPFKGLGKAKLHFWGVFKSFKSIISGVIQPLGDFFHVVGSMISWVLTCIINWLFMSRVDIKRIYFRHAVLVINITNIMVTRWIHCRSHSFFYTLCITTCFRDARHGFNIYSILCPLGGATCSVEQSWEKIMFL